jgi:hypothetical protein
MYLAVFFQANLGLSYRQSSAVLAEFLGFLPNNYATPHYSTIRIWRVAAHVHKLACYVLQAPILGDSVLAQWVLVVDESAAIGREKVLTVLATPLLLGERKTALLACDIQVLSVETANSWTGEAVLKVLKKAAARL